MVKSSISYSEPLKGNRTVDRMFREIVEEILILVGCKNYPSVYVVNLLMDVQQKRSSEKVE